MHVAVPRAGRALSVPPLGVFSLECPAHGLEKNEEVQNLRDLHFPAGAVEFGGF